MKTPEVMNGSGQDTELGMTSPPLVHKNLVITGEVVAEAPGYGPAGVRLASPARKYIREVNASGRVHTWFAQS
jgi:hypothetical protein